MKRFDILDTKLHVRNILYKNRNILLLKYGVDVSETIRTRHRTGLTDLLFIEITNNIELVYNKERFYLRIETNRDKFAKLSKQYSYIIGMDSRFVIHLHSLEELDIALPIVLKDL